MSLYERMIAELKKLNTQPDPEKIVFAGASAYCLSTSEAGAHAYIWHDNRWVDIRLASEDYLFTPFRAAAA